MKQIVKRVMALMLTVFCLVLPGLGVEAAETFGEQLVGNGGFETLNADGYAEGWSAYKGWESGFASLTTEKVHSGKYAMKISTEESGYPWVMYKAPASPNTKYRVTAKMQTENVVGRVAVKVEWSSPDDTWLRGADSANLDGGAGSWADYEGIAESIGDAGFIMIYIRLYGTGTLYVDDVELYATTPPPVGGINTDEIFFYPEWAEGHADIKANGTAYKNVTNGKADLYLKDGETVLESKEDVQLENGETKWTFSTEKMTEEGKPYALEAVIYNEMGEKIGSCIRELFRYRRPEALDENGDYYIDGKHFVPHIMYHVTDYGIAAQGGKEENIKNSLMQYGLLRDAGYNVVQMSTGVLYNPETALTTLDKLHEYGLKGLVTLYDKRVPAARPERQTYTKALIEAVKDHPAVFAYGVYDEPALGNYGLTEQDLIDTYRLVRDIDKVHPTYTVIAPGKNDSDVDEKRASMIRQQITKYTDVLCYDPYVACWDDIMSTYVYEVHKAADAFAYHSRPSYNLNQVFEWRGYFPTVDEYRHMWYQAVLGGTKGAGAFSFNDTIGEHDDDDATPVEGMWASNIWDGVLNFKKSGEMDMADEYFHTGKYPIFNEERTKDYLYRSYVDGNDLYMVILRLDETRATSREKQPPVPVSIPLVSANGNVKIGEYTAKLLYGAPSKTQAGSGTLEMSLGWRKALVYKITPSQTIDYSSISVPGEETKPAIDISGLQDMEGYDWAAEAVKEMVDGGAMTATGMFRPAEKITRAEFAGALIRTLSLSGEQGENFEDVSEETPYAKEIGVGKALGILRGTGENLYQPNAPITRQDLVTIVLRAVEATGKTGEKGTLTFPDAASVSEYARDAVSVMAEKGIVVGNEEGFFMPQNFTSRAEAAIILHRVKNAAWKEIEKEEEPEKPEEEEKMQIVFSEGEVSEAEAARRAESVKLLEALGILLENDIVSEETVTRGKAAKILVRLMGDISEKGTTKTEFSDAGDLDADSGYIKAAVDMGLMNGYGDGTFGTIDPLTYGAAVKILVDALGYKPYAMHLGGYMAGYLMKANQLELTKGIAILEGPIRGGAFARLIENALCIPKANPESYGEDASVSFIIEDGKTILSENHGIMKYEGVLSRTFLQEIEKSEAALKPGFVVIDGVMLDGGKANADALFARRVTAYAPKSEDAAEILYIRVKENSAVETVDARDILSADDGLLVYETEAGEEKVSLTGATLVYNGRPASLKNAWMPETGKVTLVSWGGNIETVIVDAYKNYIVDHIDRENDILYFKNNTDYPAGLEISAIDKIRKVTLTDKDGNALEAKTCDEWNVISVAKSIDGSVTRAIRSVTGITGKISEASGEEVTIDGTIYRIAPNLISDKNAVKPTLGQNAVYYLDMMDEIAAIDTSTKGYMYGYLVAGELTKGVDQKQKLKIFTENGKMVVFDTADAVRLNDAEKSGIKLLTENSEIYNGKVIRQLVRYITNEDGTKITELYTAKDYSGVTEEGTLKFIDPARLETFSMDDWVNADKQFVAKRASGAFFGGQLRMFGNRYLVRTSTKIFIIPGETASDDKYAIMNPSTLQHSGEGGVEMTNFGLYDTDEDSAVGAIVWLSDDSSAGGTTPDIKADTTAVVKSISKKLTDDGETVEVINVINERGAEVSLITNEDQKIFFLNVLTDMKKDPKTPRGYREYTTIPLKETVGEEIVYNITAGDVISYQIDNEKKIKSLNFLYRSLYPKMQEQRIDGYSSVASYDDYNNYWGMCISLSEVRHVGQYGISVKTHVNNSQTETYPTYIYGKTVLYDKEKASFRVVASSEIREGDIVFYKRRQYYDSFMVIYR